MFILNNVCNDVEILNILTIIKSIIEFLVILVPIILTIFVVIDIVKTVASNDVDTKKLWKAVGKRIIAAILIFLVPALLNFVISIVPTGNNNYLDCYNNAEKKEVERISMENANKSLEELDKIVSSKDFNKENKEQLNEAKQAYEKARVDIRLIPKNAKSETGDYCRTKEQCEKKLEALQKLYK